MGGAFEPRPPNRPPRGAGTQNLTKISYWVSLVDRLESWAASLPIGMLQFALFGQILGANVTKQSQGIIPLRQTQTGLSSIGSQSRREGIV